MVFVIFASKIMNYLVKDQNHRKKLYDISDKLNARNLLEFINAERKE